MPARGPRPEGAGSKVVTTDRALYVHGGNGTWTDPYRGSFIWFGTNFNAANTTITIPLPVQTKLVVLRVKTVSVFYDSATAGTFGRIVDAYLPINITSVPNEYDLPLLTTVVTTQTLDGWTQHPDIELVFSKQDRAGMWALTTGEELYVQFNVTTPAATDDVSLYILFEWVEEAE